MSDKQKHSEGQGQMFAISTDAERYEGQYKTIEEAIEEASNGYAYATFWVGKCVAPTQPEDHWNADDWLEHVSCQDEYMTEYADDWCSCTKAEILELEAEVRKVMADWLDRNHLRPRHFIIEDAEKYVVIGGKACKAVEA